MDVDDALLMLWDADIDVIDPEDFVPKRSASQARRALGVMSGRDSRSLDNLARAAGLTSEEASRRLAGAGIGVIDAMRIQRGALSKARRILGVSAQALVREEMDARPPEAEIDVPDTPFELPMVGYPQAIRYLTAEDIESIHWALVADAEMSRDPISPPGVRDKSLLAGAAFRPHTSLGDQLKYPTVAMSGAALFHSVVLNHAFFNGNKRTGLVSTLVFLERNNYMLEVDERTLFQFVLRIAKHDLCEHFDGPFGSDREVFEIATWLCTHTRQTRNEERRLKFHDLRTILVGYGCTISLLKGNRVLIERPSARAGLVRRNRVLQSHNWYAGEGRDVELNTVHKIRRELELDEEHGYDSAIFYGGGPGVPEFIAKYRLTLNRLARL